MQSLYAQEGETLDLSALDVEEPVIEQPSAIPANVESVETNTNDEKSTVNDKQTKLIDLLLASGWIGVILLLSSLFAVSLIIRLSMILRRREFIPSSSVEKIKICLEQKRYGEAFDAASNDNSFICRVAKTGLKELDRGWNAVEKTLEDSISEESAKLYRRSELLGTIGNVAPMLGLLGTVIGMVSTFGELAASDASGRNLANGIYFALVTTVDGLLVAIPVLVARSLINARIASLVSDSISVLDTIFSPIKRQPSTSMLNERLNSQFASGLREVSRNEINTSTSTNRANPNRASLSLGNDYTK